MMTITTRSNNIDLVSPSGGTLLGSNITVRGTASSTLTRIQTGQPAFPGETYGTFDMIGSVTKVEVRFGSGTFQPATPTGGTSNSKNWSSWEVNASVQVEGRLTITALLHTTNTDNFAVTTIDKSVEVDIDRTPPSLSINPPQEVTTAAPPYTTRITGTVSDNKNIGSVEWRLGNSGNFQGASLYNSYGSYSPTFKFWYADIVLPGLGSHTITFVAKDSVGNSTQSSVNVNVVDKTPPSVAITNPENDTKSFTLVNDSVIVPLSGTVSDSQTGIDRVEWQLDGQTQPQLATVNANGTWSASVEIKRPGNRIISVRAVDKAATPNSNTITRRLTVVETFDPKDPQNAFGLINYSDALLKLATRRINKTQTSSPNETNETIDETIDATLLANSFCQPFEDLLKIANRQAATQPVSQVRIAIEVLRRYLTRNNRSIDVRTLSNYCQSAYSTILQNLGTSPEELRMTSASAPEKRQALADKLGFDLAGVRPDQLDTLILQGNDLTEAKLERLFGLVDTSRLVNTTDDSLNVTIPPIELLAWQKNRLQSRWQQEDESVRSQVGTPVPVVDPDLINESDLKYPVQNNQVYMLWDRRRKEVDSQLLALKNKRESEATPLAGFDAIANLILGSVNAVNELIALKNQVDQGNDIKPQLASKRLTLEAFLHLMLVRDLAVRTSDSQTPPQEKAQVLVTLNGEWTNVYSILVQVWKYGRYLSWRQEEKNINLTLNPDEFQIASQATITLPKWQASALARRAWQKTLATRSNQVLELEQTLQTVVNTTEEATLPLLRDALLAVINPQNPQEVANKLSQELAIDFYDNGQQRTNRISQAIETLQNILFSVRVGRFAQMGTIAASQWALNISEQDFDEKWEWLGSQATWQSAMSVFAYPENILLPNLRSPKDPTNPQQGSTNAFTSLVGRLQNNRYLNSTQAQAEADRYLSDLRQEFSSILPPSLKTEPQEFSSILPPSLKTETGYVITNQRSETALFSLRGFIQGFFGNTITNPHNAPNYIKEIFYFVPMFLGLQLQKAGHFLSALDWFQTVYAYNLSLTNDERKIYWGLVLEKNLVSVFTNDGDEWLLKENLNPHRIVETQERANAYTRFTLISLVRCFLDYADSEFTRDNNESIPRARALYSTALELLNLPEMQYQTSGGTQTVSNPFPPNQVPQALRSRAEVNLLKLRTGRNIAGIERQLTIESLPVPILNNLPTPSRNLIRRPTPYRYAVLIERAKTLVTLAGQIEASYLAALEKIDVENYNRRKAGQALELANATVELQGLRVTEAENSKGLAELQQDLSEIQQERYGEWLQGDGLNQWERNMLDNYKEARNRRNILAGVDAALTVANAITIGGFSPAALAGAAIMGVVAAGRATAAAALNNIEYITQVNSANASFERRRQEWELQRSLAAKNVAIGGQQITLAKNREDIVKKEEAIATTQQQQAKNDLDFLVTKFTNTELYEWISGILGGVYRYFLQQATAMAQLAQTQLSFERQEISSSFIQADYWEPPTENQTTAKPNEKTPDRRGLTGSARLLQDIYQLDQFAFDTNKRKLQLTQTLSLAQLFPFEFQRFRQTGILPFATPMEMFDRDFPGHYLRLIKRIRLSVIALIPPNRGVRATLINSGLSRVVTGGDVFQTITVRRDPEQIAFTSTNNATGLFDLNPQEEFLLPFESTGIDTTWELQMPKAANPFDYRTIADVLFTIEYTALNNFNYREQIIKQLSRDLSAEQSFSLRDLFADAWYELHNPDQSNTPLSVSLPIRRDDFPPHINNFQLQEVLLYFISTEGYTFEVSNVRLLFKPQNEEYALSILENNTTNGILSTRSRSTSQWQNIVKGQKAPFGQWILTLPETAEMEDRFQKEEIEDIVLIITYSGLTPGWDNQEQASTVISPPRVTSISATSGFVGSSVTITGNNLATTSAVKFGSVSAEFTIISDSQLIVFVPLNATNGPILITTSVGTVSTETFKVVLPPPPTITSFAPSDGIVNTIVTITGTNLLTTSEVKFNGVVASFNTDSDTKVRAFVPPGASTGKISVKTTGGTATSASDFRVIPTISTFSPGSGNVGDSVVITGVSLSTTSGVTFNGVSASFIINSDTTVTATVPPNAKYGRIYVTTPGGTAISSSNFNPLSSPYGYGTTQGIGGDLL